MPQMKPLNWLFLFFMFSLILLTKISMNFYNINYKIFKNYKTKTPMNNKTIWKW